MSFWFSWRPNHMEGKNQLTALYLAAIHPGSSGCSFDISPFKEAFRLEHTSEPDLGCLLRHEIGCSRTRNQTMNFTHSHTHTHVCVCVCVCARARVCVCVCVCVRARAWFIMLRQKETARPYLSRVFYCFGEYEFSSSNCLFFFFFFFFFFIGN